MRVFSSGYPSRDAIDIDAFAALCREPMNRQLIPHAATVERGIPIYDGAAVRSWLQHPSEARAIATEWAQCWDSGPGVLVIRQAYADRSVVDEMSGIFSRLIAEERVSGVASAGHFASAGQSTRIWNTLEKSAFVDPRAFIRYYGNPLIAAACEAWLGPWYQMTTQVNLVPPGGQAQDPHRDYHLGFQSAEDCGRFPRHAHAMSQSLVLQGAVAHTDMDLDAGPTRFLPYSQRYLDGHVAWRDPAFTKFFEENAVQLAMEIGDAVFFNPSLHHGAGANRRNTDRVVNLFEVSSAFGKPMELLNREAICAFVYPTVVAMAQAGDCSDADVVAAIAAMADGYAFPTNLDRVPPNTPGSNQTAQALMMRAVGERWPIEAFRSALGALRH